MRLLTTLLAVFLAFSTIGSAQTGFDQLDRIVLEAIKAKQTPGAVVLIGKGDQIVYEKAYGLRAVVPAEEAMSSTPSSPAR